MSEKAATAGLPVNSAVEARGTRRAGRRRLFAEAQSMRAHCFPITARCH
jgi:hypothetical protein